MPELPEVNTFQRYFDGTSLHQRIASVEVQDDKIIRNVSSASFYRYGRKSGIRDSSKHQSIFSTISHSAKFILKCNHYAHQKLANYFR